jgi:phospholipid transport system substrate-binding protein
MSPNRRMFGRGFAVLCLVAGVALSPAARADAVSDARSLIQTTGNALIDTVNSTGPVAQKQPALQKIVADNVDVDGVAKFVLGRYWRVATPEQQQAYLETFRQLLVYSVTGQASSFQGASFKITAIDQRDAGTVVATDVAVPGKPPTTVQWVVQPVGGQPKIIDIIAAGTSMRLTERNDYAGVVSQHGGQVQALIDAMRGQLARLQSSTAG